MTKKIIAVLLMFVMMGSAMTVAATSSHELNTLDKVGAVEIVVYGTAQNSSALVDRISKLETDVYGASSSISLLSKVDKLYAHVTGGSVNSPSLIMELNAAEWSISHNVSNGPLLSRLDTIERSVYGSSEKGSITERTEKLLALAYSSGTPNAIDQTVYKDKLVKIEMVSTVDSKTARVGDVVEFKAADDVYESGVLVIAKGAAGAGHVTKVEHSKNFGRDAVLELSFDSITLIDGSIVATYVGEKAKEETKSMVTAAGASVAGMAILGPVGIVGGAFVNGKDVTIKAGSQLFVQTKEDVDVVGLNTIASLH